MQLVLKTLDIELGDGHNHSEVVNSARETDVSDTFRIIKQKYLTDPLKKNLITRRMYLRLQQSLSTGSRYIRIKC